MNRTFEELRERAIEELKENDDLFVSCVEALDSWNGYADGFRAYPMYMIDELFGNMKVSEFLDSLASGFDHNEEYFIDTIYGLDSTDDLTEVYRDNVWESELLDNLIDCYDDLDLDFIDDDFKELLEDIIRKNVA